MAQAKNVDFSNVKDGGQFNRARIPAGDYLATVTKVDDAEAKDGVFQYLISIKINKLPRSVFPYYCKLQENQLWKLRNLLIAGGLAVPKKRVKVDPNRLVNKLIGVTIEDDEYNGQEQSTIAGVFPAAELGDVSADTVIEDDEPAEDEEPEEALEDLETEAEEPEAEAEDEDPIGEMDRVTLKAEIKKYDANFVARKSQTDDDLRAILRAASTPAETEADVEEEEPEAAPAAKPAATRKAATEVSDDELEELDIDNL
jgi:hypothetical protein